MAKFDPKKPHGETFGDGATHRYEQDGKFFDANGNEVGVKERADLQRQVDVEKAAADAKRAAETGKDQVAKQLEG